MDLIHSEKFQIKKSDKNFKTSVQLRTFERSQDLSPMYVPNPEKMERAEIGAARGKHKWNDLYYFGALAASRHATIHIFSGLG